MSVIKRISITALLGLFTSVVAVIMVTLAVVDYRGVDLQVVGGEI
jgi:hypothetical protein